MVWYGMARNGFLASNCPLFNAALAIGVIEEEEVGFHFFNV